MRISCENFQSIYPTVSPLKFAESIIHFRRTFTFKRKFKSDVTKLASGYNTLTYVIASKTKKFTIKLSKTFKYTQMKTKKLGL